MIAWKIHWPSTVFALVLLPCLLGLGFWQLARAEQKRVALEAFEERRDELPVALATLPAEPLLYTRLSVQGEFDNQHSFLLDNRISDGVFGYEVITPFTPAGATRQLLINRGWIEGDPSRKERPRIAAITGVVALTGYVYREDDHIQFVANSVGEERWPKLVQTLRLSDLQTLLAVPVYPFIVRLDPATTGAYKAEWQIINVGFGPERHTAYAVTWFAMAVALVGAWLFMSSNLGQLFKRGPR